MFRKRRIAAVLVAVLIAAGFYVFGCEPRYSGRLVTVPARPLIFAHRGFGVLGPDNSLYAAERAFAAGMDGVDVDGQFSVDSEIVIFHDLSVDRLTAGSGRVRDLTRAQLLALDLGPKFDPKLTGATVRTFEDFVIAAKGRGILMVELKVPSTGETGIEARAVEVIRRHAAHDYVVLSSFNPVVLRRLKRLDPNVRTAFIFMDTNWNPELLAEIKPEDRVDLPWIVRQEWIRRAMRKLIKPDLLSINHEVNPAVTARLIAKGWPVFIWTPNDDATIRRALARHPYGVISDQPLRARDLRDQ